MLTVSDFKIFVDTNILFYANTPNTENGEQAVLRLRELLDAGTDMFISGQIIREYANATLRDAIYNKLNLGENISSVMSNIEKFRAIFEVIYNGEKALDNWLDLLPKLTTNKDVFDFNIAATMQAHGISHILTNNEKDFVKFSDWLSILPLFPEKQTSA